MNHPFDYNWSRDYARLLKLLTHETVICATPNSDGAELYQTKRDGDLIEMSAQQLVFWFDEAQFLEFSQQANLSYLLPCSFHQAYHRALSDAAEFVTHRMRKGLDRDDAMVALNLLNDSLLTYDREFGEDA